MGNQGDVVTNGLTDTHEYTDGKANEITSVDSNTARVAHDKAGNMTKVPRFDDSAVIALSYDAWNRLVAVTRAWEGGGENKTGSTIATMAYDGTGRRTSKTIDHSGDWNHTYHYYYDGQAPAGQAKMIETRNGNDQVIKQHVWGMSYVDEIIQIGINENPGVDDDGEMEGMQDNCETFYYACQDANYNVIGLVDSTGDLVERYEYTPYGQRTVFQSAGADDVPAMVPTLESQRVQVSTIDQPYGRCDIGHQGLIHDKEFGLIYNRRRYLEPVLGIYTGPDPKRYVDGMNYFEYVRSNPVVSIDPTGTRESNCYLGCCPDQGKQKEHTRTLNEHIREKFAAAWKKANLKTAQKEGVWQTFVKEIWATMAGSTGAVDTSPSFLVTRGESCICCC